MTQRTIRFEVIRECSHTRARAGLLHTPHGTIETPVFIPVGTLGSVKGLTQQMLEQDLDARIILANTYHLLIRPGPELIASLGGLHQFMSWPRAILTDSGGFQVFSLSALRKITDDGVVFRSHLDGAEHRFTPESTLDVQAALGSDIKMVLDECTEYPTTHEHARRSMLRTARWAERGLAHLRDGVFSIVQGSMVRDLRRECACRLADLDADGYALGGLSVGEPRSVSLEMVEATEDLLPRDRPRYCMGVGMLDELGEYVARGIDMMDCVLPTRNARNGYLFTSCGRVVIKHQKYRDDPRPIDEKCPCQTCSRYSRSYLRHLFLSGEILFSTLASYHNVFAYLDRMRQIRHSILFGNLPNLLNSFSSQRVSEE
ncbi:MAG: tRNA guanosine(34) transglycosylase Tgt [Acidobacteria bacterium]|nr:tRNA guanosine(34) transglycosylase Tgt [Acidobacteriota bacterium]